MTLSVYLPAVQLRGGLLPQEVVRTVSAVQPKDADGLLEGGSSSLCFSTLGLTAP